MPSAVVALSTTSGTGSEVARGAIVITDDHRKLGFHSWHLLPRSAICDPELTLGLPPGLTAATGMDAIAHCMETFMAAPFNPPADGIALDGLERGWAHIERATRDGQDREARLNMMSTSVQGALAFQKGLGAVHSLSHSLGGANPRLHHGTLNVMFLPAVVGMLAGLSALRLKGLYLALVTLMLAGGFQVLITVVGFPDGGAGWLGRVEGSERLLMTRPALATSDAAYLSHVVFWLAALLAGGVGQLDGRAFGASESVMLLALSVVGGVHHWLGAIIAGLMLRAVPALLTDFNVNGFLAMIFFGAALLHALITAQQGVAGLVLGLIARLRSTLSSGRKP